MTERMSDAEGLMWRLEKDPFLSSTFSNVSILDRPMNVEAFMRRGQVALQRLPSRAILGRRHDHHRRRVIDVAVARRLCSVAEEGRE